MIQLNYVSNTGNIQYVLGLFFFWRIMKGLVCGIMAGGHPKDFYLILT